MVLLLNTMVLCAKGPSEICFSHGELDYVMSDFIKLRQGFERTSLKQTHLQESMANLLDKWEHFPTIIQTQYSTCSSLIQTNHSGKATVFKGQTELIRPYKYILHLCLHLCIWQMLLSKATYFTLYSSYKINQFMHSLSNLWPWCC